MRESCSYGSLKIKAVGKEGFLYLFHHLMPCAHRSYKLSKISFVNFSVSKLLLGNPQQIASNLAEQSKQTVTSNRVAHAHHTKDVSK